MRPAFVRMLRSVAIATVATASLIGPAAAGEPVDPSTLNPPPPASWDVTCEWIGKGILCNLAFSDPAFTNEPSAIMCGATELLVSQTRSVIGKRYYDADGDLLKRHFREDYAGTLTNPATGNTVAWLAQDTVIDVLGIPGDDTTGRLTVSGEGFRVFVPDGPTVLVDAGRLVIDKATGEILESHGPHHFDDYFVRGDADALGEICDALA